ncbi:hypothetical protein BD780_001312 [Clostridium tetanomorphum]|uniref:hypothetical protein n=1 Tax=Clostridium tetanomorphum TaxID=1553 RepID=UPI00044E7B2D|nr:hypothetical protein [Clostridium tetanomorphum]KAJ53575.1 hypothetical protein CTM_01789 [Clostridium tetanomorphum DSM 665]MBP1864618.1 hypothetical protein [Clostridium tetanomorphum]NRS84087.1 hypothetical protein [Clostridium tetanomorphum]SQB92782.1 Uncharacterised protein [Clostridium tetanomorphum]
MNQPEIIILHSLHNRIRVKLSHPLRNVGQAIRKIKENNEILKVEYNPITKSILVHFNYLKVEMEEVIFRIAIAYSEQYDMVPIKLLSNTPTRDMPALAHYSIMAIVGAAIVKFLGISSNKNIQDLSNWIAVGTTVGAIIEHGYKEINEKGAFDPEVVSVMYLINSVSKGNFIRAAALTWVTTFGRHILDFYYEGISIKVNKLKNSCTQEEYYEISLCKGEDIYKKVDFMKAFVTNFIEKQNFTFGNNILINKGGMMRNGRNAYTRSTQGCNRIIMDAKYGN